VTAPTPLTCAEIEALLPLVADGVIDQQADAPLFAHLATCEHCQEALARHDLVSLALADPAGAERPRLRIVHRRLPLPIALASAAAAALAVGTWWLGLPAVHEPAAPMTAAAPEREVIRIDQPGREPAYLVRDGDRLVLVTPDTVDGKRRVQAKPQPVSLPLQRY
jgi:hypothetical protein